MEKRDEKILKLLSKILATFTTRERYAKIIFKNQLKYRLNLKNPKTFAEKINWLKLNYFHTNELAIKCTDKYKVREYIESKGLGIYLNELIGHWDDARKIDFSKLPNKFIFKVTHGCGYNILVTDKTTLNIKKTVRQLNKWLREDYGMFVAEPHYTKLRGRGRIVCEKYLEGETLDYKFFIFNGEPKFMHVSKGCLEKLEVKHSYFDEFGNPAPFGRVGRPKIENFKMSYKFDQLKELSIKLAKDFPFVRVDWLLVDGEIYFSELTFTPGGGLIKFDPPEFNKVLGDCLYLPTPKVIISLTSFPARINTVHKVIKRLLNQRVQPNKVVLYLATPQFPNQINDMPAKLREIDDPRFEIRFLDEDIKSYKKLIPALVDFPNDIIITVDDDKLYRKNLTKKLLSHASKHPGAIVARRIRFVKLRKRYRKWPVHTIFRKKVKPSFSNLMTGVGGVLYPPNSLHKDVLDKELFTRLCPTNDDIWFWAMAVKQGTKIVSTGPSYYNRTIRGTGRVALFHHNKKANDAAIKNIISEYPYIEFSLAKTR